MGKIHISYPFMIFTAVLVAADREGLLLLMWTAVMLHELGHLAAITLMGWPVEAIHVGLLGLRIDYGGWRQTSYLQDGLAAAAGPAANLLAAGGLALAARLWPREWLFVLIGCHVVLGVFNLLPALPMDGGRVALALAGSLAGPGRGVAAVQAITGVTGALMTAGGLWLLLETGGVSFVPLLTGLTVLLGAVAPPRRLGA